MPSDVREQGASAPRAVRRVPRLALALGGVAFGVSVVVFLEGAASLLHAFRAARESLPVAEWRYCTYDPDLGWVARRNVRAADLYGPGRGVATNARGFRGAAEIAPGPPPGKIRVVCSGDSFTFGYGVDTEDAWCNRLARIDPLIEPVNMGQGGYGADQAYLWYMRDGAILEDDIQLLVFDGLMFERMQQTETLGFGKPVLALEHGRLLTKNTPVPRRSSIWRYPGIYPLVSGVRLLRLTEVARSLRRPAAESEVLSASYLPAIVQALVEQLAHAHQQRNRVFAVVYLPLHDDCFANTPTYLYWSALLRDTAARTGAIFIDLVPDFRQLPGEELEAQFISAGDTPYFQAAGHLSAAGNRFVASRIHAALGSDSRVNALAASVSYQKSR
ncbi:MAG TPA: hypothetical protein VI078_01720 [bacterium]